MKRTEFPLKSIWIAFVLSAGLIAGCGGNPTMPKKDFFTSGNQEADQRADQRMAKTEQLKNDGGKGQKASADVPASRSLYERLGGENGIKMIVDDFVARLLADPRVNFERKGIKRGGFNLRSSQSMAWSPTADNIAKLKTHFIQFMAVATGGPAHYGGEEMRQAHTGRHITNDEFDAAVGDLKATLDKLRCGDKEQKELIAVVESTRPEVVEER
jgi:hemoglobin